MTGCQPISGALTMMVPFAAAGTCKIHVVLKDGEVFDDTVVVKDGGTGCCGSLFADHFVLFTAHPTSRDAGTHD
jgi:hypothetical protein